MARFATVAANDQIVTFTTEPLTYNPLKGDAARPGPWRSLPCPVVAPPVFDPQTEVLVGPTYIVNANDVSEVWAKRALTAEELSTTKDNQLNAADIVAMTALFNHENRIRALEAKAAITKAQFITALKGLLP